MKRLLVLFLFLFVVQIAALIDAEEQEDEFVLLDNDNNDLPELELIQASDSKKLTSNVVVAMYHFFEPADKSERGANELNAERTLVAESVRSWQRYAARHGYAFLFVDNPGRLPPYMIEKSVHPSWYRFKLLDEIAQELEDVEFVILVESDVVCTVPMNAKHRAGGDVVFDDIESLFAVYETHEVEMVDPGLTRLVQPPDVFVGRTFSAREMPQGEDVPLHGKENVRYLLDLGVIVARVNDKVRLAFKKIFASAVGVGSAGPREPDDMRRLFASFVDAESSVELRTLGHTFVANQRYWEPGAMALQIRTELKRSNDIERRLAAYHDSIAMARHLAADQSPYSAPAMLDRRDITCPYTEDWRVQNFMDFVVQ